MFADELPKANVPSLLTVIPEPELTVWFVESITGWVDPAYTFVPDIVPAVIVPRFALIALSEPTFSVAINGATQVVNPVPGLYIPFISHRFCPAVYVEGLADHTSVPPHVPVGGNVELPLVVIVAGELPKVPV